jgi:hypothetical protein
MTEMSSYKEPGRTGTACTSQAKYRERSVLSRSRPTIREIRMLSIRKSKRDVIDYYERGNLT